jgi:hypothetical protein
MQKEYNVGDTLLIDYSEKDLLISKSSIYFKDLFEKGILTTKKNNRFVVQKLVYNGEHAYRLGNSDWIYVEHKNIRIGKMLLTEKSFRVFGP